MSQTTTITNLPNASTPLTGNERVPMDQDGVTVDATTADIANLAAGATDLAYNPATRVISSSTGDDATLPEADGTVAGLLSAAQFPALSNSREWAAATISQAEAEAGTAVDRRAFTAQRVRQAIVAWWATISATIATLTTAQTLSNKTLGNLREAEFLITDAAGFEINPANGPFQRVTIAAARTPVAPNFLDGQGVKLRIAGNFAVTWTTMGVVWLGLVPGSSGTAPAPATTGWLHIELWREQGVTYGALIGYTAT